ncbi:sphingosine kinase [Myriangium duriaei CBS 260.36]|uniref:Sphingosine kinase n=1 Tax=Myriangium duriaei CBS 260.36 TaxID=1168546 RepID=A0A9P4J5U5_9PEZI|nr:sphingosine kinase [Myriangium duriaei CBS 260.36]
MASDPPRSLSDPFMDPAASEHAEDSNVGSTPSELQVDRNACLSLREDALVVSDAGLAHSGRKICCGLIPSTSSTTLAIPYYNILDATLDGSEVSIKHALFTSKTAVRPAYITYTLADKSTAPTAKAWVSRLLASAYRGSVRARRLKVLINPHGGKGLAPKLYAQEAEPILKAAGCEIDAETTTHSGHALEIARDLDIDKYDAIVCCSGDGTPHEVFNGLAQQAYPRRALRKIAVTLIPGGSGNALAINLNGTTSPSVAALAIVKAARMPLDLVSVSQGEKRILSFLSQSWGIVAECDLDTEDIRWMGSARFTFGFFKRLVGKTVYPAEVSVKVEYGDKDTIRAEYKKARYGGAGESSADADHARELHDDETTLPKLIYGTVNDPVPEDWVTTDMPDLGNFFCGNLVHMSADAPFFPAALPNDGLMDLFDVDGTIGRLAAIKLMVSIEQNQFFDQPDVHYKKIKAFRLSPRLRPGQKQGFISVDGERIDFAPLQAEIMPGLGTVLGVPGKGFHFDGPQDPTR